jgi:glycosyltransferase involved in cell wall biosynthesis
MSDEEKRIKIAYLTSRDARDRRTWSGTYYYMAQALQKHCGEVTYIGPLDASTQKLVGRIVNRGSKALLRKSYLYQHSFLVAKKYAKVASEKLAGRHFDVIVAPAGAQTIPFLKTNIPVVLVDDGPYALLYDYYPLYSNLLKRSVYEMDTLENLAIKKASLLVYSSAWAAQSAIEDYHADQRKVHIAPFGANFEDIPSKETVLRRRKSERCKLLFIGVDWQRKGGDIAFEALLQLEKLDITAELIVCGCTPPKTCTHERMKVIPFLDKNDELQRRELDQLFIMSDFLLVPTRADCTPMAFCEANAFGLPVITTSTGGVPEVVRHGENGFLLPYDARGAAYADVIARLHRDHESYTQLVRASRDAFENRLNWDAWGVTVQHILAELPTVTSSSQHNSLSSSYEAHIFSS